MSEIAQFIAVKRDPSHMDLSTLAHELKTPLTVIKGAIELMQNREVTNLTPEQSEMLLGLASRNAERLSMLVEELLARASGNLD